jgi:hypothetical protein
MAEWQAAWEVTRQWWKTLAEELGIPLRMSEEEQRTQNLAAFAEQAALWCSYCGEPFTEGQVAHRKRRSEYQGDYTRWALISVCERCVSGWHPSWLEHRRDPVPCTGGCGLLVSSWDRGERITRTCSPRCSEIAQAARKRVQHEPRTCDHCGERFVPRRVDARYCSPAHRQAAYRRRQGHSTG